jgi:hypothetical protein
MTKPDYEKRKKKKNSDVCWGCAWLHLPKKAWDKKPALMFRG